MCDRLINPDNFWNAQKLINMDAYLRPKVYIFFLFFFFFRLESDFGSVGCYFLR